MGDRALRALLNLLPDRHAIGVLAQTQKRQENDLFKLAQELAGSHMFYKVYDAGFAEVPLFYADKNRRSQASESAEKHQNIMSR